MVNVISALDETSLRGGRIPGREAFPRPGILRDRRSNGFGMQFKRVQSQIINIIACSMVARV